MIFKLTTDIMRKIILEMEYIYKIYQMLKFFKRIFSFEDTNNTGLLIFDCLKEKKLIFNFFVNRN